MENKLSDKEEGRLDYIMRKHCYVTKETCDSWMNGLQNKTSAYYSWNKQRILESAEAHDLLDKKGLTEEERQRLWVLTNWDQRKLHYSYKNKPTRVRQDNKTEINYGKGNSSANTIRYPKKNRKTAWKRFYKLFPHLKKESK